jgi:hypothetical protein
MRLLTSTTIFLAALTLASAAYAQDGARAYDPNQLPSYRGQVQFFTLTPPGDIDAPPGPKGQLRAPSPPAPSADAGPPPPPGGSDAGPPPPPPPGPGDQADNAARRLLHLRQGADSLGLRRRRRRRRISASLAVTI